MKPIMTVFKTYHLIAAILCIIGGIAYYEEVISIAFLSNAIVHMILYAMTLLMEERLS